MARFVNHEGKEVEISLASTRRHRPDIYAKSMDNATELVDLDAPEPQTPDPTLTHRERFQLLMHIKRSITHGGNPGTTDIAMLTDALFFTAETLIPYSIEDMAKMPALKRFEIIEDTQRIITGFTQRGANTVDTNGRTLKDVFESVGNEAGVRAVDELKL